MMISQSQSALLRLPGELRHEIYSYVLPDEIHVRLQSGKLCLSPCFQSSYPHRRPYLDGQERNPAHQRVWTHGSGLPTDTPTYLRRLNSTWASHWMCEEHLLEAQEQFDTTLALVCKSMYSEIFDLLSRHAVVHIIDLDTLYCLDGTSVTRGLTYPNSFAISLSNVTQLSISLRLPLKFFQTLEQSLQDPAIVAESAESTESNTAPVDVQPWLRIGTIISQLKRLKKLRLKLDYDEPGYWAVVNEKALLEPLLANLSDTQPSLQVTVTLPKLHPKFEQEDRHYIDGQLPGTARLHRVLRQMYWKNPGTRGRGFVEYKPDFPFLLEFIDLFEYSLEELEYMERGHWKAGDDMEQEARELMTPRNEHMNI